MVLALAISLVSIPTSAQAATTVCGGYAGGHVYMTLTTGRIVQFGTTFKTVNVKATEYYYESVWGPDRTWRLKYIDHVGYGTIYPSNIPYTYWVQNISHKYIAHWTSQSWLGTAYFNCALTV